MQLVMEELELESSKAHFAKFPKNELATVSIHYLLPKND